MSKKVLASTGGQASFVDPDVFSVARTLTSAEILALNDVPIELLPEIAGHIYFPITVFSWYRAGGTPYHIADGRNINLVAGVDLLQVLSWDSNLDGAVVGVTAPTSIPGDAWPGALALNMAPNPTLGDGTLDVTVIYRIVDIS